MIHAAPFQDRVSGALLALALLGVALSLVIYSFDRTRQAAPAREFILSLPRTVPPRQEPATIIDARGASRRAPSPAPLVTPSVTPSAPPAAIAAPPPAAAQGTQGATNMCAPERLAALTPEERAGCQGPQNARPRNDVLTSPYQPRDQQRFDEEMARKNNMPGPGIPAVGGITDPFCKLAVFLLGAGGCGAVAAHHQASDAQVRAAIDAANQRRGAVSPAALTSAKQAGDGDAKDTHAGGGDAAPGAGPARPGR